MEDDVRREFAEVGKRMQDLEKKFRDYILANPGHSTPNTVPAKDVAAPTAEPVAKPLGVQTTAQQEVTPKGVADPLAKPADLSSLKS